MKRVEDLMSRVVITLKEHDTINVAKLEMDIAAIRHLPVVDGERRVVGLVSLFDLLQAFGRHTGRPIPVADVMIREVRTVRAKTPAHEAARRLLDHKIGSLPVLDADDRIVGMITETDFLRVAEDALERGF